jgi:PilZ domain
MEFPQRQERRDFRYPLHLPVVIRMDSRKEMQVRSENISLSGILLSSAFSIPEGSTVEVSIGVTHLPDPGILLNASGKVLRVRPKDSGEFSVAIRLDEAFKLPLSQPAPPAPSKEKKPPRQESRKNLAVPLPPRISLVPVWYTET